MLTREVSQNYFNNALTSIHRTRANALFETAWALTQHSALSITSLGRNKRGKAFDKHKIKSVDRLIGNPKLHAQIPTIYKEFFQSYMASLPVLNVIVDWSGCCRTDVHMLRASIVHDGRSLTIYNEIHPQENLAKHRVHLKFLAKLRKLIPFGKPVVIITDAGFITPWFDAVLKLGWDYVGRLKGDIKLKFEDRPRWMRTRNLHKNAKAKVRYEGKGIIGRKSSTPVHGYIYSYKKKSKKREDESRYPDVNKRYGLSNKTPWIIATSLKNAEFGKNYIRDLYAKRMQIEQTFRDDKAPRYGYGWRFGRTYSIERIAVLCLISAITTFFLLLLGTIAEKQKLHLRYQVNTTKNRRVLSLITLAKLILKNEDVVGLFDGYEKAIKQLIVNNEVLCRC